MAIAEPLGDRRRGSQHEEADESRGTKDEPDNRERSAKMLDPERPDIEVCPKGALDKEETPEDGQDLRRQPDAQAHNRSLESTTLTSSRTRHDELARSVH